MNTTISLIGIAFSLVFPFFVPLALAGRSIPFGLWLLTCLFCPFCAAAFGLVGRLAAKKEGGSLGRWLGTTGLTLGLCELVVVFGWMFHAMLKGFRR